MPKLPTYEKPPHPIVPLGARTTIHMMEAVEFLRWTVEKDQLEIANYLPQMKNDPFFLVAATGLGKTVAVPVHVLIRQIQRSGQAPQAKPRVWVIEPRIPIAIEQAEYMNHLWDEYRIKRSRSRTKTKPLFGCVTSASGRQNRDAPIQFVTTGIFELLAKEGSLDPINDRVIIDEAHVTVEQNPGVELGIALCRKAGITVDYMSATVDVRDLESALGVHTIIRADKTRNIIWKSNLQEPIDKVIDTLVQETLVSPNRDSGYFPAASYRHASEVIASAFETGRSHGMLVVVNSFNGDTSDVRKLTDRLRKAHPQIPVLHLAGDVVRDPRRQSSFKQRLREIEARQQNYVILATSVVEMGITFPTLDYVVTMDSGYDQETIGDVSFPVVAPLGVNSLLQRIGRVGRRRPGIAYISNEVGADYSSLDDTELNGKALAYEPIRYPLTSAPLMPLAYYAAQQKWENLDTWLTDLRLPSKIQESPDRMEFFREQFEKLEPLGITKDGTLTELGRRMEQWIGRADIAYASQLQKRLVEGASAAEVLFWIVATALSNTSVGSLKAQYGYFVDYDRTHTEVANRIDVWSGMSHEDIALFRVITQVAEVAPRHIWESASRTDLAASSFYKWSNWAGLDARKIMKAAQAVSDTLNLFAKINSDTPEYQLLFGRASSIDATAIRWREMYTQLPHAALSQQLASLAGTTTLALTHNDALQAFEWTDDKHGHQGVISQDDTPIHLAEKVVYTARVAPSRNARNDEASWRPVSLGIVHAHQAVPTKSTPSVAPAVDRESAPAKTTRATPSNPPQPVKKRSFLDRLFGR